MGDCGNSAVRNFSRTTLLCYNVNRFFYSIRDRQFGRSIRQAVAAEESRLGACLYQADSVRRFS